jgi:hypothetical protein
MAVYYYTPLWAGDVPNADPDLPGHPVTAPGMVDGAATVQADPMPTGISLVHYDDVTPRCVVAVAEAQTISGWAEETKAQVDADYPGVFP